MVDDDLRATKVMIDSTYKGPACTSANEGNLLTQSDLQIVSRRGLTLPCLNHGQTAIKTFVFIFGLFVQMMYETCVTNYAESYV